MKVSLPPGAELFVGMFIILGVIVFFPYIIKFIRFTGLWLLPVEVLLIDTLLVGKVLKLEMNPVNYPEIYPIYETAMVVLWVATVVLVTGYHLYKLWREWHPKMPPLWELEPIVEVAPGIYKRIRDL